MLEAWKEVHSTLSALNPTEPSASASASQIITQSLLPLWTAPCAISTMKELTKLLDEIWSDKYVDRRRIFEERGDGMGKMGERGGEREREGCDEMVEIVLGILGRYWPEG